MKVYWALVALIIVGCSKPTQQAAGKKGQPKLLQAVQACDYYTVEKSTRKKRTDEDLVAVLDKSLVQAARQSQNDIAELLVARGADVQAEGDDEGPLDAAAGAGDLPLIRLLIAKGANVNRDGAAPPAIVRAAAVGSTRVIAYLLAHGADVDATNPGNGNTALHTAAQTNHLDAVQLLLQHNAQTNRIAWQGTPLDLAIVSNASPEVIDELRRNGAVRMSEISSGSKFDEDQFLQDHPDKSGS